MSIEYAGNNPMILSSIIHGETDTGFLATGYKPQITGLLSTGNIGDEAVLRGHIGREYFKKLHYNNLGSFITDDYDEGFRPLTFTGLYA
jgi:hypothetical protein